MSLSPRTKEILTTLIMDLERRQYDTKVRFPLGLLVHRDVEMTDQDIAVFFTEIRNQILFPKSEASV